MVLFLDTTSIGSATGGGRHGVSLALLRLPE